MTDRRRVLKGLLLAGAGLALPAACGVPSGGRPIVDGNGPPFDPVPGQQGDPPSPSDANSPSELVELFLAAASGPLETSDQLSAARERGRAFLTRDARGQWQPVIDNKLVAVVRVGAVSNATTGRDQTTVACTIQQVGVFDGARGLVDPSQGAWPAAVTVEFTVIPNPDRSGFLISSLPIDRLPAGLVLSSAALDELYFTPQLVYFWDSNRRGLVPDLRYLPRAGVPSAQQRADVVRWLIGGPSDLIRPIAANIIPDGTDLSLPNVLTESNQLVVNLTGAVQAADPAKVMSELRWSLNPQYALDSGTIQLQIASRPQQVDGTGAPYIVDNPADASYRDVDARPFCVVNAQVYPVESGYPVPPVLAGITRPVLTAAVSRDRQQSALVCGDNRLWLGRATKVGGAVYTDSGLTIQKPSNGSRPVFLPSGRRVLVVSGGTLLTLTGPDTATSLMDNVLAFSVAPDGYRIAVVQVGMVTPGVAGVGVGALRDTGDRLTVMNLRPLDPGLTELRAVAWTRLDRIVVSGHTNGGFQLAEVTIDGAIQTVWTGQPFRNPITWVVAYPKLPSQPAGSGPVLVQTESAGAFRAFVNSQSLPLVIESPSPQSTPSSSGTTAPLVPTAPFFVD